jgi:hypothetical protein
MFITWNFSYRSIEEGVLHGALIVSYIPLRTEDVLTTFTRVLLYNLGVAVLGIVVGNLVRIRSFPIGYALSLYHWGLFGTLLGTNSFVIAAPGKWAPSLMIFDMTGFYELIAYTLIATATCGIYVYRQLSLFNGETRKVSRQELAPTLSEGIQLALGLILLAVANYLEACQILRLG